MATALLEAPTREPVVVRLHQALAMFRQGDMDGAESLYCEILRDDPGQPDALHILGLVCERRGDYDLAESLIWRSIQMHPHSRAYLNMGVVQQHRGRLDAAIASYRTALSLEPDYSEAWANLIFALDIHPYATPALLKETRQQFDAAVCAKLTAHAPPHANDRAPDRRLRVGYVSGDFRLSHSAAQSFAWLTAHDPEAVEVYLYSTYEGADPTSDPFKARADVWAEVGQLAPHELAQAIYGDAIDILVDLAGPSLGGRPLVFAMKPAPIQIGGWGYSSGLGIGAMDYLVSDPIALPAAHADRHAETLLPFRSLVTYSLPDPLPDLGPSPEERNGYRTYGYLGRPVKATEATLAAWAVILRRDPTSRLVLKSGQYHDRQMRERVSNGLSALGVSLDRIEIQGVTSRHEHLLAHNDVDVCLDSFPQSGGMSTCDALLMGVPVATLIGETVTSRTSASILTNAGLFGWISQSVDGYVNRALAPTLPSRREVRDGLLRSPLVQTDAYARSVEAAYRTIWQAWCGRRLDAIPRVETT